MATQPPPSILAKLRNGDLVGQLLQHGAAFVIVGGTAVAVHGCRDQFDVDDLDLLIEPTLDNAQKVVNALSAGNVSIKWRLEALARPSVHIPIKVSNYWADILTPERGVEFALIIRRSIPALIGQFPVRVAGRSDLIAMKESAVTRINGELTKHKRDLQCLRQSELASERD